MPQKIALTALVSVIFLLASVSACTLSVTMVNQDPYPAVPGDYVDVVFQITGVEDPACGLVTIDLLEEFPFSLDPGVSRRQQVVGGTVVPGTQFKSFFLAPYSIRVSDEAIDGTNTLKAIVTGSNLANGQTSYVNNFSIEVEAADTNFEVAIKDYDQATSIMTFEILNIGENDVEAVTVVLPKQANLEVKGANRNIVGSLDSNDDTTFTFEVVPKDGDIEMDILYTDLINVRRTLEARVTYDSSYFTDRAGSETATSPWFYVAIVLVLLFVFNWWRGRRRKKKKTG